MNKSCLPNLFAKPISPDVLDLIRTGSWQEAKKRVQAINLNNRSLRKASLVGSILLGADLRNARLQGANLGGAKLQGADLGDAELQGANLRNAKLQGANLRYAKLQGADLGGAELQGANLDDAELQGSNLDGAELYGVRGNPHGELVKLTNVQNNPLTKAEVSSLVEQLTLIFKKQERTMGLEWDFFLAGIKGLEKAAEPGAAQLKLQSCLAEVDSVVRCEKKFILTDPEELQEFINKYNVYLINLACESTDISSGLLKRIEKYESKYKDFKKELKKRVQPNQPPCPGLQELSAK
jgi:uncharacterized protein YjbI with pentapeptide repeats